MPREFNNSDFGEGKKSLDNHDGTSKDKPSSGRDGRNASNEGMQADGNPSNKPFGTQDMRDAPSFTSDLVSLISNNEIEIEVGGDGGDVDASLDKPKPPSSNVFVPIGIQATMPISDHAGKAIDGNDTLDAPVADRHASDDGASNGSSGAPALDAKDSTKLDDSSDDIGGDTGNGGELTVDLADVIDLANVMAVSSGAAFGKIPSDILAASTDANPGVNADADATEGNSAEAGTTKAGKGVESSDAPIDPVAARRIAHGLSPVSPFDKSSSEASESGKRRSSLSGKDASKNASDKRASNKKAKDDADGKAEGSSDQSEANTDVSPQKRRADRFRDKRRVERDKKEKKTKRKRVVKIIIAVLIGLFVALVLALFAALAFVRSGMIDDTQEIKGTWRSTQSGVELSITDDRIVLTDDVAYKYTIDPNNKTISFTFGNLEGSVRYRLSLDGKELSLYDTEVDSSDTFIEDIPWLIENLWAIIFNDDLPSAYLGKGSELLERVG